MIFLTSALQLFLSGEWKNLLIYLGVIGLACIAYGAIFLLLGLFTRNPMVGAFLLYFWEIMSISLPPTLKSFSLVYYLNSVVPVRLMEKAAFAIIAEPASPLRVTVTLGLAAVEPVEPED